uniref:AMP-dependent synthetase/ligase domain-containing protein n=1 Tax=viral metagenome TaxID=1070528 RepID=A0A6C0CYQ6_9ZZZZ
MDLWLRQQLSKHSHQLLFPLLQGYGLHYESLSPQIKHYTRYYQSVQKVVKNQRVIVSDVNRPQFISKIGALWELGATPCLLSPSLKPSTKQYCQSLIQTFPFPSSAKTDFEKEALVLFTSGTSSLNPKGVVLSHTNLLSQLQTLDHVIPTHLLNEQSRTVALLPWTHCYGLIGECLMTMQRGGQMHPISKYHPLRYWMAIQRMSPTTLFTVPAILESWQRIHQQKLKSYVSKDMAKRILFGPQLQYMVSGGAKLSLEVKDYFYNELGVPLLEGYGCTEMSPMIALQTDYSHKDVGTLLPGIDYTVSELDQELWVRGPNRFLYYLSEKGEDNASPLKKGEESDASPLKKGEESEASSSNLWYATGDRVNVVNNKIYLLGRKSEQVKTSNGRFLRLEEIENYVREYHFMSLSNIKDIKKVVAWQHLKTGKIGVTVFVPLSLDRLPLNLQYENLKLTVYYASSSILTLESGMMTQKGEVCRPLLAERCSLL